MSSPLGEDEEWVLLMLDKVVDEEQLAVRLKIVNENLLQSTMAGSAQNLSDSHFELLTKGCVHWLTRGDGLVLGEPTARLLATLVTVCATRQQNRQELFSPDFCAKLIHGTTGRIMYSGIATALACMHTLVAAAKGLSGFVTMIERQPERLENLLETVATFSRKKLEEASKIVILELLEALYGMPVQERGLGQDGGSALTTASSAEKWLPVVAKAAVAPQPAVHTPAIALLLRALPEMPDGPPDSVSSWLEKELKPGEGVGEELVAMLRKAEPGDTAGEPAGLNGGETFDQGTQAWGLLVYLLGNRLWGSGAMLNRLLLEAPIKPLLHGFTTKEGAPISKAVVAL